MEGKARQAEPTNRAARQRPQAKQVLPASAELLGESDSFALQRAIDNPAMAAPAGILALQRTAGNRAVGNLIQTKLTVGPVGDHYEQEADRVAEQVMQMGAQPGLGVQRQEEEEVQAKSLATSITPIVQRQEEEEEELQAKLLVQRQEEEEELQVKPLVQRQEEEEELQMKSLVQRQEDEEELQMKPLIQRQEEEQELQMAPLVQRQEEEEELQMKPFVQRQEDEEELQMKPLVQRRGDDGFEAGPNLESRLAAQKGGGSPLSDDMRAFMEPRFGADFSGVRLHTDGEAADLNRSLSAQAFTHGQDIYMPANRFNPGTAASKRLLAHELTHVVQQTGRIQPRIQRWDIKGHEIITAETVRKYNTMVEERGRQADPPWTEEQIEKAKISTADMKQFQKGATWNDLLGHTMVGFVFQYLLPKSISLTARSHKGELQFLHGMAAKKGEEAWQTQRKIMLWAEFCYKIATGAIKGDKKIGELTNLKADIDFQGGGGVSIADLFDRWKKKTVSWLFTDKKDSPLVRQRALGSMMHMLQDTFCVAHSQRVAQKAQDEEARKIRGFNVYGEQSANLILGLTRHYKNRHHIADLLKNKNPEETAGAKEAVQLGAKVLDYVQQGAAWEQTVKPYLLKVFALVPELERQAKGGEEAGTGETKGGRRIVSASGRQFRKPRLSNWFKSESKVRFSKRPSGLKLIDHALKGYEITMFGYELDTLTEIKSNEKRAGELQSELSWLDTSDEVTADWLAKNQGSKSKDIQKRNAAVTELQKKLAEDRKEIEMDLDAVSEVTVVVL
jgi:hypothetical protein